MADVKPLILQTDGSRKQAAQADVLLVAGITNSGGTIALTGTAVSLPSGTDLTGSSGAVLSGFDSIEGITSANLVDKTAAETVTGVWTYQRASGDGAVLIAKERSGQTADTTIFEVQDSAGSVLMSVDNDGDLNVQGSQTFVGGTTFNGNVTFGDATSDTVTFTARVATGTDIIPQSDSSSDLGSDTLRFQKLYADEVETPLISTAAGATETAGEAFAITLGAGGASGGGGAGGAGSSGTQTAGAGGAGDGTNAAGAGGAWVIAGGAAGADGGGGGANGGDLTLRGGAGTGAGTNGVITIGATNTASVEVGAAAIPVNIAGAVTIDGNSTIGDAVTDTITFTGRLASGTDLIPIADGTSDLGTTALRFANVYTDSIGDSGQVLTIAGGLSVSADAAHTINLLDNSGVALDVQQGSDDYLLIDTTNGSEAMSFGNATTNPSFTFLGSGAVNVTGTLNADGDLTVDGSATIGNATSDTHTINGIPTFELPDNTAIALLMEQGADDYFLIATTDGSEKITFGNAVTNPDIEALGSGLVDLANGTLDVPSGTSFLIAGTALTTANFTAANIDTLLDGSNADALHTHSGLAATDIQDTDWTTTGTAVGDLVYASGNKTATKAIATAQSTALVVGVVTATSTVAYAGRVAATGDDGSAPSAGTIVYLSETTAGRWTATAPTGSTEVVAAVGIVADATGYTMAGDTVELVLRFQETTLLA